MSYTGYEADIRIGRGGLLVDENPEDIPDSNLIRARNIDVQNGMIQKEPGSRRWNNSPLPSGIIALLDWFPTEHTQRFIAVTRAGKVYRYVDPETVAEIAASTGAPTTMIITPQIQVQMTTGGQETLTRDRKIFILSGNSQIQVISGDGTNRTNIGSPNSDWASGNYPRVGVVHRNRFFVFLDHHGYASSDTDHEQFTSNDLQFPVYPGEGERIVAAVVFKGKLFVFKSPFGVYALNDDDTDSLNWYFQKLSGEVGGTGPDAQITAVDDFIIANSIGTLTSYAAVNQLGDVAAGDIFSLLKVEKFVRETVISAEGVEERRAIYYSEKKIAYFAARSPAGIRNDRIMKIDFSRQTPQLVISEKDQANCFALRRISNRKKPFYGSEDGYIYEMDREDRDVAGTGYIMDFQTPHVNFGYIDPKLMAMDKLFDSVQFRYVPTGRFNLSVDYFVDGMYVETLTVKLAAGAALGDFTLARDRLTANSQHTITRRLRGMGKTISFRCYNSGTGENIKLTGIRVFFRAAGNVNKSQDSGR